jgi:hypothetical protein
MLRCGTQITTKHQKVKTTVVLTLKMWNNLGPIRYTTALVILLQDHLDTWGNT